MQDMFADTVVELAESVNNQIEKGWRPIGGIAPQLRHDYHCLGGSGVEHEKEISSDIGRVSYFKPTAVTDQPARLPRAMFTLNVPLQTVAVMA